MIYFVLCRTTNKVKIGFAADPWKRLSKIQSDTPNPVEIIAVENGDVGYERQLHRRFVAHWCRGEWFEYATPIREYAENLPKPLRGRGGKRLGGALGSWLYDQNLTLTEFGRMIGCSKGTLSQFCAHNTIPRKELMQIIYVATHGAVQPNDFYDLPDLSSVAASAA